MMMPTMDKSPIVTESKMNESKTTDEVKETNEADKTNQAETTNGENTYKFSDLCVEPFGVTCDVTKDIYNDEAYLYVTVKNPTGEFVNISDNLTGFKQYIKGKNLVFDKCSFDFDTIKKDTEELEIYLNPDEEQQFSIHYKKPLDRVDFQQILEKKREDCVVISEKTKQDEKNKNIEIASVEIENSGKFPFYVSKMKDYFRKDRSEGNYEFLNYTIEDIAIIDPDETIKDENANILINANSTVRICAIYNKKAEEDQQKSDDTIKDVYCNISELNGVKVSNPEWLKDNLVERKVTINNNSRNRLHVKAKAGDLKEHFKNGAKFLRFSGNSIVKKTNEEIELVVDSESTGSFEVYFEEKPEDVHCSFSDLEGKPGCTVSVGISFESNNSFTNWFNIKNNSNDRLFVKTKGDDIKKYFKDGSTFFNFSENPIEKKPEESMTVEVAPRSSSSFAATFRDTSKDVHCNLSELVDSGYCTSSYHGKFERTDLVEREYTIKNPLKGILYVTLEADYLKKRYFGEDATFSHFCDELIGEKTDKKIELVVGPQESRSFKVYFETTRGIYHSDLTWLDRELSDAIKPFDSNLVERKLTIRNIDSSTIHVAVDEDSFKEAFPKDTTFEYLYDERIGKITDKKIELVVPWQESATFNVYYRYDKPNDVHCRLSALEGNNKYQLTVSKPYKKDNLVARTVTIKNQGEDGTLYVTADAFYLKQQYFGKKDVFSYFVESKEKNISKQIELKVEPKSERAFEIYFIDSSRDMTKDVYRSFSELQFDGECFKVCGKGISKGVKEIDFEIKNSFDRCLHVTAMAYEVKNYFEPGAAFRYFYEESLGEKEEQKIEFVIPPKKTGTLKAYFYERGGDPYYYLNRAYCK